MKTKKYAAQSTNNGGNTAKAGYPEVDLGTVSVPFSAFQRIVHSLPNGKQKTAIMSTLNGIGAGYAKLGAWFREIAVSPLEA